MRKKILLTLMVLPSITTLKAQDSAKVSPLKITGAADVYYRYDFNNPRSVPYNNFTSFTHSQNSFELGMVSVKAEHHTEKAGMVADIGFGKRVEEFSYNDVGSSISIKQLYFSWAASSRLKLTLGSWTTHIGYELVDASLNRNYSMSYMFSYGPFFHTGIKGEYTLGAKTVLMLGITNPADLKNAGNLPKMLIAQLATGTQDDQLKTYFNYQGGKNNDSGRLYQGDIVVNYTLSERFSLGYNGTLQYRQLRNSGKWEDSKSWWGSAIYINADPQKWLGFTLRGEYLSDQNNVLGFGTGIMETTFSTLIKIDNLTLIPELRFESAGKEIFTKPDYVPGKNTGNFLLAAVYKF